MNIPNNGTAVNDQILWFAHAVGEVQHFISLFKKIKSALSRSSRSHKISVKWKTHLLHLIVIPLLCSFRWKFQGTSSSDASADTSSQHLLIYFVWWYYQYVKKIDSKTKQKWTWLPLDRSIILRMQLHWISDILLVFYKLLKLLLLHQNLLTIYTDYVTAVIMLALKQIWESNWLSCSHLGPSSSV